MQLLIVSRPVVIHCKGTVSVTMGICSDLAFIVKFSIVEYHVGEMLKVENFYLTGLGAWLHFSGIPPLIFSLSICHHQCLTSTVILNMSG